MPAARGGPRGLSDRARTTALVRFRRGHTVEERRRSPRHGLTGAGPGPARVAVHRRERHPAGLAPAPRPPEAAVRGRRARRRREDRVVVPEAAHAVPPRLAHLEGGHRDDLLLTQGLRPRRPMAPCVGEVEEVGGHVRRAHHQHGGEGLAASVVPVPRLWRLARVDQLVLELEAGWVARHLAQPLPDPGQAGPLGRLEREVAGRLPPLLGLAPVLVLRRDEEEALRLRRVRASVDRPSLALDDVAQRGLQPQAVVVGHRTVVPDKALDLERGVVELPVPGHGSGASPLHAPATVAPFPSHRLPRRLPAGGGGVVGRPSALRQHLLHFHAAPLLVVMAVGDASGLVHLLLAQVDPEVPPLASALERELGSGRRHGGAVRLGSGRRFRLETRPRAPGGTLPRAANSSRSTIATPPAAPRGDAGRAAPLGGRARWFYPVRTRGRHVAIGPPYRGSIVRTSFNFSARSARPTVGEGGTSRESLRG